MSDYITIEIPPNDPEVKLEKGLKFFSTIYEGTDFEFARVMYNGFKIMIEEKAVLPFPGTDFHVLVLKVDAESRYKGNLDLETVIRIKGEIV